MRSQAVLALLVLVSCALVCGQEDHGDLKFPRWSYNPESRVGPSNWGNAVQYAKCRTGESQSPINIVSVKKNEKLRALDFDYQGVNLNITNNGNFIHIDVSKGSYLNANGQQFELVGIDFHARSEHRIRGLQFPLEVQLIHKHRLQRHRHAIVSIVFVEGAKNKEFARFWSDIPREGGNTVQIPDLELFAQTLLPKSAKYFTYSGSLTAPPCEENTRHYVMAGYQHASRRQIAFIRDLFPVAAARPVQKRNNRIVFVTTPEGLAGNRNATVNGTATAQHKNATATAQNATITNCTVVPNSHLKELICNVTVGNLTRLAHCHLHNSTVHCNTTLARAVQRANETRIAQASAAAAKKKASSHSGSGSASSSSGSDSSGSSSGSDSSGSSSGSDSSGSSSGSDSSGSSSGSSSSGSASSGSSSSGASSGSSSSGASSGSASSDSGSASSGSASSDSGSASSGSASSDSGSASSGSASSGSASSDSGSASSGSGSSDSGSASSGTSSSSASSGSSSSGSASSAASSGSSSSGSASSGSASSGSASSGSASVSVTEPAQK